MSYTYGLTGNARTRPATVGGATYTYDCDGNITSGGGRTGMLWDTENRLTSVTNASVTETYSYDADGERITRTSGGVTTVYLGGLWPVVASDG